MSIPYLPISLIKKLVLNQRFNFHPTQTLDPSPRFQASLDEIADVAFFLDFQINFSYDLGNYFSHQHTDDQLFIGNSCEGREQ